MDLRLEWIRRANQLHKSNRNLSRQQVVNQLKAEGYPRPPGIQQSGFRGKGEARHPVWGKKTTSKEQRATRVQHEQPSTDDAKDHIQKLREWQETVNNMAAYAGMEGAHHEHNQPSDMSDVFGDEGAPGDYVDNRPNNYSKWKTAVEQYNRTRRGNRYRLIETPEGARIVSASHADARVDPYSLPGIDVDESMDVESVFSTLPFIVGQDLSLPKTSYPEPHLQALQQLLTPQQSKYTPPQ